MVTQGSPVSSPDSDESDCCECSVTRDLQDIFRILTVRKRREACNRYIPEIREVLWNVCEDHEIHFAQTWAPCDQQFDGGCGVSIENQCVSVVQYDAFYMLYLAKIVMHVGFWSFHWARGEGHVGKAFMTKKPCLSIITDATHHSPYFFVHSLDYVGVVAIHIKGTDNNAPADYVLEFFFPYPEEPNKFARELCSSLNKSFKSLRVVTDEDAEVEEVDFPKLEPEQGSSKACAESLTQDQQSNDIHEDTLLPDEFPSGASADGLQDPSDHIQDETCPDATVNIEHAQVCEIDIIGTQGTISSVIVGETSEERSTGVEKTINSLSDAPKDAAKTTAGKSGRRARTKQDPAWKYCSELIKDKRNGPIRCSFCSLEIKGGGITRFKFHLLGRDLSKNIKKCPDVSPEAKAEMEEWLRKYNAKRND